MIINGMPDEKRFSSNNPRKLIGRILREALDALLLVAILASIAFLVYYLQIPAEDRPPLSDLISRNTGIPAITNTVTPTPALVSTPSATQTRTFTATPSLTATSTTTVTSTRTATHTPSLVSSATLLSTSATQSAVNLEIEDGIEQGNRVIQAIEAYTRAKGFYPAALDDLVPDYLPELPFTSTDQPFFYRVFDRTTVMSPEIYWISFRVVSQDNVTCTYYRRLQYWDCNFASP